jgi:chromosomal replication initiator protein
MQTPHSLARFFPLPEQHSAWTAIQDIPSAICNSNVHRLPHLIYLHGPPGCGKSLLVGNVVREAARRDAAVTIQHVSANDWPTRAPPPQQLPRPSLASPRADDEPSETAWLDEAGGCDLLALEDLQHLPARNAETLAQLLDARQARRLATLVTANVGPRQLAPRGQRLPARLTSRLAAGLVVTLESLQAPSRLRLLEEFAQRKQLAVAPEILRWLADHLTGGGRQLEGAVAQLDTLGKLQRQPLKLADIRAHFRVQVDALRPSVERIVQQVGGHFHVAPEELRSRRRLRAIVAPRQIGMYLARQLTRLSLKQIGVCFGGHDHSTVLHACRKVERTLKNDALMAGAVKQLHAELA